MASLQASSHSALRNETTSLYSHITNSFLATEPSLKATCSLFSKKPLSTDLVTSSLQIIHSCSGKKSRVIVELTFLCAISVNSNIPIQTYLGVPFTCNDALISLIRLLLLFSVTFQEGLTLSLTPTSDRSSPFSGLPPQGLLYFGIIFPLAFLLQPRCTNTGSQSFCYNWKSVLTRSLAKLIISNF